RSRMKMSRPDLHAPQALRPTARNRSLSRVTFLIMSPSWGAGMFLSTRTSAIGLPLGPTLETRTSASLLAILRPPIGVLDPNGGMRLRFGRTVKAHFVNFRRPRPTRSAAWTHRASADGSVVGRGTPAPSGFANLVRKRREFASHGVHHL